MGPHAIVSTPAASAATCAFELPYRRYLHLLQHTTKILDQHLGALQACPAGPLPKAGHANPAQPCSLHLHIKIFVGRAFPRARLAALSYMAKLGYHQLRTQVFRQQRQQRASFCGQCGRGVASLPRQQQPQTLAGAGPPAPVRSCVRGPQRFRSSASCVVSLEAAMPWNAVWQSRHKSPTC